VTLLILISKQFLDSIFFGHFRDICEFLFLFCSCVCLFFNFIFRLWGIKVLQTKRNAVVAKEQIELIPIEDCVWKTDSRNTENNMHAMAISNYFCFLHLTCWIKKNGSLM